MINILHLYYDILNLYGENGNIKAFENNLKANNIKYSLSFKSLEDKLNFSKYDIIYIGSGDEEALLLCMKHLSKYKKELNEYINNGKYLFLTGNAMYMFGKRINDIKALNIFNYEVDYLDKNIYKNASTNRIVGETVYTSPFINETIIGFQNRCGIVKNIKKGLFKSTIKYSNDLNSDYEGFTYKNVYATQTIGPLFIRNPYLLDYFLTKICKDKGLKYKKVNNTLKTAYKKYLDNF